MSVAELGSTRQSQAGHCGKEMEPNERSMLVAARACTTVSRSLSLAWDVFYSELERQDMVADIDRHPLSIFLHPVSSPDLGPGPSPFHSSQTCVLAQGTSSIHFNFQCCLKVQFIGSGHLT